MIMKVPSTLILETTLCKQINTMYNFPVLCIMIMKVQSTLILETNLCKQINTMYKFSCTMYHDHEGTKYAFS